MLSAFAVRVLFDRESEERWEETLNSEIQLSEMTVFLYPFRARAASGTAP